MFRISLCLFVTTVFINLLPFGFANIPKTKLCFDEKCSVPISEARGQVLYSSPEKDVLSFKAGTKITILSKTNEKDGYWGAKIGNNFGYVPKVNIRETQVYHSNDELKLIVPTNNAETKEKVNDAKEINAAQNDSFSEISSSQPEVEVPVTATFPGVSAETINDLSKSKYEEIDGTTIYDYHMEEVSPSATAHSDNTHTAEPSKSMESSMHSSSEVPPMANSEPQQPEIPQRSESEEEENDDEGDEYVDDEEDDDEDEDDEEEEEEKNKQMVDPPSTNTMIENDPLNVDKSNVENQTTPSTAPDTSDSNSGTKESTDNPAEKTQSVVPPVDFKPPDTSESDSDTTTESGTVVEQSTLAWEMLNSLANMISSKEDTDEEAPQAESDSTVVSPNEEKPDVEAKDKQDSSEDVTGNSELGAKVESDAFLNEPISSEIPSLQNSNEINYVTENSSQPEVMSNLITEQQVTEEVEVKTETKDDDNNNNNNNNNDQKVFSDDSTTDSEPLDNNNFNSFSNDQTPLSPELHDNQNNLVTNDTESEELPTDVNYNTNNELTKEAKVPDVPAVNQETEKDPEKYPDSNSFITPDKLNEPIMVANNPPELPFQLPPAESGNSVHEEVATVEEIIPQEQITKPDIVTNEGINLEVPKIQIGEKESDMFPSAEATSTETPVNSVVDSQPGLLTTLSDSVFGLFGWNSKNEQELHQEPVNDVDGDKQFLQTDSNADVVKTNAEIPDASCKSVFDLESDCKDEPLAKPEYSIWDSLYPSSRNKNAGPGSFNTLLYLVITAVTVLLFTLGYYFIEKSREDSPLVAKVNELEQELLVSSKECGLLKEELKYTKDKLILFETSNNDAIINALQAEVEELKRIKLDLEASVESLQQELDSATEAGLELNKMLTEVLTQKDGSSSLMESVERLQTQLDNQKKVIDDMNISLVEKNQENEALQGELISANEKIENLEEELNDMRQNLHVHLKEKEDLTDELTSQNNQLQLRINQLTDNKEKETSRLKKMNEDLAKQVKTLTTSLSLKEGEFNALKESINKLDSQSESNLQELFNVTRVKAELENSEKEKRILQEKLNGEESARKSLEDHVKAADAEVQKLRISFEEAEKEKFEAQTKLEVLSKYFKEKEMQLQKELGLQEAMWAQKQGDDSTIYERIKSLQEEIDNYKSQTEMLKKEILDQERGLKGQIASLEKKAHENWVAARQAERKLEESKQEAGQLRNRLTMIEKNMSNELDAKQNHRLNEELNGGEVLSPLLHDASSPLHFPPLPLDPNNPGLLPSGFIPPPMFMPPPPSGFMPPPPFLPGDRRPPPLGRMSSPPLNSRFSPPPPPPDYSYERTSPPPMPSPVRNYSERERDRVRHRTPPSPTFTRNWEDGRASGISGFRPISSQRESGREHKGSTEFIKVRHFWNELETGSGNELGSTLSSGRSSSDSLDKSSRHSGRV